MKRPTKCPICGAPITKVTNAVTKNSYYRCSNQECHFVLKENYTDAEFYLQGKTLNTICLKCHSPLTIANGPHGLYARCFKCSCDTEPTSYNRKVYPKWANAHKSGVKQEIEQLVKAYQAMSVEDELYDFEVYIAASKPEKHTSKKPKANKRKDTYARQVLAILEDNPEKMFSANDISSKLSLSLVSIRNILRYLKESGLAKIVKCESSDYNSRYLSTYYQSIKGSMKPIVLSQKSKNISSVCGFCIQKNNDRRVSSKMADYLEKNNIEWVPTIKGKGVCKGYKVTDLEKAYNYVLYGDSETKQLPLPATHEIPEPVKTFNTKAELRAKIIKALKADLTKPYSTLELTKVLSADKCAVKQMMKALREEKRIKVVDWEVVERQRGASTLKYQVTESPLARLKVTVDNNSYVTAHQFFDKKLRGKRVISLKEVMQKVKGIESTPLLINHRAYVGYPIATLKEIFKDYINVPNRKTTKSTSKVNKITAEEITVIPAEVEAATLVSNPIKKNSFFGTVFSFFGKKKENPVSNNC